MHLIHSKASPFTFLLAGLETPRRGQSRKDSFDGDYLLLLGDCVLKEMGWRVYPHSML